MGARGLEASILGISRELGGLWRGPRNSTISAEKELREVPQRLVEGRYGWGVSTTSTMGVRDEAGAIGAAGWGE